MKVLRRRLFHSYLKMMLPKMLNIGSIEVQSLRKGYLIIYPQTIVYQLGWGGGTQKVQEMVPKRYTSGTHEVQEEVICAPDNARPLALFPPIFASPQITCGGLSVPSYTSSPPSRFVSPQFVAEFSSPSTCGGQNFPSSFSLLNFCHNFPPPTLSVVVRHSPDCRNGDMNVLVMP